MIVILKKKKQHSAHGHAGRLVCYFFLTEHLWGQGGRGAVGVVSPVGFVTIYLLVN